MDTDMVFACCHHSSCSYRQLRNQFLTGFQSKWWGTKSTVHVLCKNVFKRSSEANERLRQSEFYSNHRGYLPKLKSDTFVVMIHSLPRCPTVAEKNPTKHAEKTVLQLNLLILQPLLPDHFQRSRPVSSHLPRIFKPFHSFHYSCHPPNTTNWERTWCVCVCVVVCVCVCVLCVCTVGYVWAHACVTAMKTGRWGGGRGWARAVDVPVSNTFPQVEVCSPGGCVAAGDLCNEQEAGSLPDQIPPQPHIYTCLPKMFSIPVGFIDLSEQTAECKLCLVRCAVNRFLTQECPADDFFICNTFLCF